MSKRIDKKLWGVLGKQQTYYSPQQFLQGKTKVPLNANPFDSWDVKRSRFNRVDGYENAVQQGGTVIGQQITPNVSPTPSITPSQTPGASPNPTPSNTATSTSTPTPTPSITPVNDCYWNTNDDNWENDSTLWNDCVNVPSPTPTNTQTNTPTSTTTSTPTNTPTSTNTPTPSTSPLPSGTTEARTYLAAVLAGGGTGITSTESAATETLFTSLVSNNLWDKLDVFYPMIGGTSGGMKVNGKNPGTNDLTFNGGWTFGVSGATGNGTNSYADTGFRDNQTSQNDMHMAVYNNLSLSESKTDCGVGSASANTRTLIYCLDGTTSGWACHRADSGYVTQTIGGNAGTNLFVANRTASNNEEGYRNGTERASGTTASVSTCSLPYYLGARSTDTGAAVYSSHRYCWFSLGKSFSDSQQSTFNTIINDFQDTLNRNTLS